MLIDAVGIVKKLLNDTAPAVTEKSLESNEAIPLFVVEASSPDIVTVLFDPEVSIPSPANIFNACVFKFTLPDPKEAVYINVDAIPVNPAPSP